MPEAWVPVMASMIASANIVAFMEPLDVARGYVCPCVCLGQCESKAGIHPWEADQ